MRSSLHRNARRCATCVVFLCVVVNAGAQQKTTERKVTVQDDATSYTLSNGVITALVDKKTGDLLSMKFKGAEMMAVLPDPDGKLPNNREHAYWSHDAKSPNTVDKVTIDPASNGGLRGEVSVKGISNGAPMGSGPGGTFIADIEIRWALGAGDSGIYTYSIFEHQPSYPATVLGEARFCSKIADFFDWMSVGPKWNKPYPKAAPGEHEDKYDFTADQFENPAFGWSSTTKHVGFWFLNPSVEYLSGGPTKVEFLGHRDTNDVQAPTILNYWRSSHYGGAVVDVDQGEHWAKVIGPFMLYVNEGGTPQAMYSDAVSHAKAEQRKWPYDWVSGVDYSSKSERVEVTGHIVLRDSQAKSAKLPHLLVGLTAPAYLIHPTARDGVGSAAASAAVATGPSPDRQIDWQTDAKHYEFWVDAAEDGNFKIPGVRPGKYTLHAFADGVLGELAKMDITVTGGGKPLSLGTVEWIPKRYGRQVWEIGIPNRTGEEFAGGKDYARDGTFLTYAKLYPNDINYTVGKSDYTRDWYFEQVPHNEDPNAKPAAYNMRTASGRATPWKITFDMPTAPTGRAHLRLGLAGTTVRQVQVGINGQPAIVVDHLYPDSSIGRNGIHGIWSERDVQFDAGLLQAGTNTITLTVPAGTLTSGIIYDYLRLELE